MKYKMGDKIVCFHEDSNRDGQGFIGKTGVITGIVINHTYPYVTSLSKDFSFGDHEIKLLNEKTIMSNAIEFFRNITATAEEKLLKEFGLENPIGVPTDEGLRLSAEITYGKNRAEVIEVAKKMKEEKDKESK